MDLHRLKKVLQFDTAGWFAISSLLICALSGALLAIPYDFTRAYASVFELLLFNPTGAFMRNLHYWSAQLLFVSTLLHIYDHLSKSTETNIRGSRTWLILCLVTVFLGYEMISGFILKGDAAGIQARRIIASMLESVPFGGRMLNAAFIGSEENWLVVYVQHIATGTIFLFIGVYEHVKTIWPKRRTFTLLLIFLMAVSLVFRAPLGLAESNQLKGPWFFVGIQELLHFISHPGYLVLMLAILLLMLVLLPRLKMSYRSVLKKLLLAGAILYLMLTAVVLLLRGENWQWRSWKEFSQSQEQLLQVDPVQLLEGSKVSGFTGEQKIEGCLVCHKAMTGLSDSHNPAVTGCYACHLGDPFTTNKQRAHHDMVLVPGDFSNVRQTCGTQNCHAAITDRVLGSLMTTQSGIIAVDKFIFGETGSLNDTFHIKNLMHTAADTHLRNLCAGCHLGKEKTVTGNAAWLERGGGCNACHLHYSNQATESMQKMQAKSSQNSPEIHPAIDIQVSNDRCKSCHSRSGRISLNYEGWNETAMKPSENSAADSLVVLPDERVLRFVQADIHHQKGMACIDCHNSYEVMGDGGHHRHKEEAVTVQCLDCHPAGKPKTMVINQLPDLESQLIAGLRQYNPKSRVVSTSGGERPLLNTRIDSSGQIFLTGKLTGKLHLSKPAAPECTRGEGHKRLSCESCHTAWVPQCIGCHNSFEPETNGFDLLTGKKRRGTWVEYAGVSLAELPVLGVSDKAESRIVTTMPGMIMTLEHSSFDKKKKNSFHRLYSPASGHTTQRAGRNCKSCHNNPLAIGYGRGTLHFEAAGGSGEWRFEPQYALSTHDNLPEDAWIGFLKEPIAPWATRSDLRPFSIKEQQRILEVGSCLTCHEDQSKVMVLALNNFAKALAERSVECVGNKP